MGEIDGNEPLDVAAETLCFHCKADPKDMEWEMLLCDFCYDGAAHCSCVTPPFSAVPEGQFGCPKCVEKVMADHGAEYEKMLDERLNKLEKRWTSQKEILSKRKDEWKAKQRKRTRKKTKHKQHASTGNECQNTDNTEANRGAVHIEPSLDKSHHIPVQTQNMNLPPMMSTQLTGHPPQAVVGQVMMSYMNPGAVHGMTYQQVQMNAL